MLHKIMLGVFLGTSAQAAIVKSLDELKLIEAPISQNGLTRIAVKGDRIAHVFGVSGEYDLTADEDQGQIFIRPLSMGFSPSASGELTPFHITLTTELGKTQDLRLIPQDKKPEALILHSDEALQQEIKKEKQNLAPIMRGEVEDLILAAREGRIPLGYKLMPLDLTTLSGPYLLIKELRGDKLCCLTYEIKNHTNVSVGLSEEEFSKTCNLDRFSQSQNPIAIFMSKKTLNPGEGALIYVVIRALQ